MTFWIYLRNILIILLSFAAQSFIFFALFSGYFSIFYMRIIFSALCIFTAFALTVIAVKETHTHYKLALFTLILTMPFLFFGFYLLVGRSTLCKKYSDALEKIYSSSQAILDNCDVLDIETHKICRFIKTASGYPVYADSGSEALVECTDFFDTLISCIAKSKRFIFLDIFILKNGLYLNRLAFTLIDKSQNGVDVRIIYDSAVSKGVKRAECYKKMLAAGVKIIPFNPALSAQNANIRNHRKLIVCDGQAALTGGLNIVDDNYNLTHPYGKWRDSAVMITGMAANSFTVMFLRFWEFLTKLKPDYANYINTTDVKKSSDINGYVQPFSDGPHIRKNVKKGMYSLLITQAKRCVYISTPYLLPDDEITGAIKNAAQSGVDVKILTPHIPDKKMVFKMTRSFYHELISAGAQIYEYSPGFNHSKTIITDSNTAYIGSCNLDYRSFHVQYECGAVLYNSKTVLAVEADFLSAVEMSKQITLSEAEKYQNPIIRLFSSLA